MARARRSKARPFGVIDAETDPFLAGRVPEPFLWGFFNGADSTYHEFTHKDALLAHLDALDAPLILYAHNGGKFDFHYLRDDIEADTPIMVISGRLASFKIGKHEFRDSLNLLTGSLAQYAKEKIDYAKFEAAVRHLHMVEISAYLRSDCLNLYQALERYFSEYGRGMTQAGSAMRYWKKTYKVPFRPQTAGQSLRYRDFYYGGRVECFVTGHGLENFSVVDINSAYPRAMMEKHPIAPDVEATETLPPAGQLQHALVKVAAVSDGALPWRDPDTHKLSFPNDGELREYAVTGWELEAGLELNRVRIYNVLEVRRFTELVDFADYVQTFWEKRRVAKATNDKPGDMFAKLFLNSLYGKWAADPEKYREYVLATGESWPRWARAGYEKAGPWGERELMSRPLPEEKHHYFNVATAASITGYVRAMLLRGMAACEGVMYCDTDSIVARDVSRLPVGSALGEWKLELEGDEYAIAAKKTYALHDRAAPRGLGLHERHGSISAGNSGWKTACKGVRLTPHELMRCAQGESITTAPEVPTYSIYQTGPIFVPRVIKRMELNA